MQRSLRKGTASFGLAHIPHIPMQMFSAEHRGHERDPAMPDKRDLLRQSVESRAGKASAKKAPARKTAATNDTLKKTGARA